MDKKTKSEISFKSKTETNNIPTSSKKPTKALASPANDRLKRLQTNLQKSKPQFKKNGEEKESSIKKTQKIQSTKKSSASAPFASPKDRLKLLQGKAIKEQLEKNVKITSNVKQTQTHALEAEKKNRVIEESGTRKARKRRAPDSAQAKHSIITKEKPNLTKVQKNEKIAPKQVKAQRKDTRISSTENTKKPPSSTANKRLLQNQVQKTSQKSPPKALRLKFLEELPKHNTYIPQKPPKNAAKKRLEILSETLQNENHIKEDDQKSIPNKYKLVSNSNEDEAMDWETIGEPIATPNAYDCPVIFNNNAAEEPMDIDENLMLVAADEKQELKTLEEKWRKPFIYIVIDTNVFISHLAFIEELRTKKVINALEIVLYVPYSVLQELDRLKRREDIKMSVVRAIRYLNRMFEKKSELIQAQSAMEESKHLIKVESADDSILNCCLQVQLHIPNVILLSEDVNLRNKAICNNISVSTITDLPKKQFNF